MEDKKLEKEKKEENAEEVRLFSISSFSFIFLKKIYNEYIYLKNEYIMKKKNIYIFEPPRRLVVKNPPASARDMSSIPESGRSPGERNGRLYSPGESDSTS